MRNKRLLVIGILALTVCSGVSAQLPVLTLDSCLKEARQHNCTIRSAQLDVLIAREVKKQMQWKYFPQVSLESFAYGAAKPLVDADVTEMGSDTNTKDFLKEAFDILDKLATLEDSTAHINSHVKWLQWGVTAQARAVQPVFWGGQIVTANKLAKLGIDVAQLKEEVSERDVLQEVADAYWLVAGLLEKRATIQKATELLDTISKVADNAYNHGIATKTDLLRVQLKQNEMQTKHFQLENGIQLASRLLCHLIGHDYTAPLMLEPFPEDESLETLTSSEISIDGRPEHKLLQMNIRYNQLMRRLTLGETLPHLAIGVTGGYSNFFQKNTINGIAFVSLSIPLTAWGETSHKLKQHDLQIQQAQLMLENYGEKMNLQNRQVYDQMTEAMKLLEQHKTGRELAQENYRIALINYKAGIGTMTELMESEALLLQAENAYTDARITYRTAVRKFKDYNR